MTGLTLLQGQWEVLQTCCTFPWQGTPSPLGTSIEILTWGSGRYCRPAAPFPLARDSFSFGNIHWDFDLAKLHCCTWWPQSCSLNGVQCGQSGTGRGRFLQEPSLPPRPGNGKAKRSCLGCFPLLREEESPLCLQLPVPWYLPMSHTPTLLEGLESSRGFSPCNCLCAGTSEQMRLLVVVQTPRILLTHSFVVLQLRKGDFHGRGLGNTPCVMSAAPRAGP